MKRDSPWLTQLGLSSKRTKTFRKTLKSNALFFFAKLDFRRELQEMFLSKF